MTMLDSRVAHALLGGMSASSADDPPLLEGLTEPALVIGQGRVLMANAGARDLLGGDIEGAAVAKAVAHPASLQLLDRSAGETSEGVEFGGLGQSKRHWLMRVADLSDGNRLVRFVDR